MPIFCVRSGAHKGTTTHANDELFSALETSHPHRNGSNFLSLFPECPLSISQ